MSIPYGHDNPDSDVYADEDGLVHGDQDEDGSTSTGVLVTLSDVKPERVTWLWHGRLPAGKLVILEGDPSLGKSTLGVEFAAHVTTGRAWPDGELCPIGDVLILSAEDGLADTLRPRLDVAGADPTRVHSLTAVSAVDDDGGRYERPPHLGDIGVIRAQIKRTGATLVVIDVLMAYMPSGSNSHHDQDVRAVLHRVKELAEETGCCILLLRHLNKSSGGNAMYRGGGSIGIIGAARSAMLVAEDPDDPEARVIASQKANLTRAPASLSYRLTESPIDSDYAIVEWIGRSEHRAGDLLSADSDEDRDERSERDEWLLDLLASKGGTAAPNDIYAAGKAQGYSVDQIKRSKRRLKIRSEKDGLRGGWYWHHPARPEGGDRTPEESEGGGVS